MSRYTQALLLAAQAHAGQVRKSTTIPYITHPVAVSELVARFGGDEDQQIAALLHDVLEDCGESYASEIGDQFGDRVLGIVRDCTDGTPDNNGQKAPWKARKLAYLEHLAQASPDTLLVSACDKLHNLNAIRQDRDAIGDAVFERFTASQAETEWYYQTMVEIFERRRSPVAGAMRATFDACFKR